MVKVIEVVSIGVFIVNLWIYFTPFPSVSIINFEQVNLSWGCCSLENKRDYNVKRECFLKKCSEKFHEIHNDAPVMKSYFQ